MLASSSLTRSILLTMITSANSAFMERTRCVSQAPPLANHGAAFRSKAEGREWHTDLLREEIDNGALVFGADRFAPVGELVHAPEVAQQVVGVHHRHHRVQSSVVGEGAAVLVLEGEGLGHLHGLGDAGALDEEVVVLAGQGEPPHFDQEILPQGAADAPVLHLHQLLLHAVERRLALLDQRRVDVDLAHVVHDHRHLEARAVRQDVVEQSRLTCAQTTPNNDEL